MRIILKLSGYLLIHPIRYLNLMHIFITIYNYTIIVTINNTDTKKEKKSKFMVATGEIEFNRNKYGITYNSETSVLKKAIKLAKDKIIKDTIKLTVTIQTASI